MGVYQGPATKEISFPLGGIGTGSIGLAGNGRLIDWEIFGHADKGSLNGYSHIAVKAKTADGKIYPRVLNGDAFKDFTGQYGSSFGFGIASGNMCGFPHFQQCRFTGEFPLARIDFSDPDFPLPVQLTAFNPLIPLDDFHSSLPAAFFCLHFQNSTPAPIEITATFSLRNPFEASRNTAEKGALHLYDAGHGADELKYGDLTLITDAARTTEQACWYRGLWQDAIATFWREFSSPNPLPARDYPPEAPAEHMHRGDHATLCVTETLPAGEGADVHFVLSWNVPNMACTWAPCKDENGKDVLWKHYYATQFQDSAASAAYCLKHWDMLYQGTLRFHDALFSSTLDAAVIDAASATLSVLKSPTVLRLQDGSFYGWEGLGEHSGSCEGTCTHVWNYAYALCFLFPKLERSIRELDYTYNQLPDGSMCFRLPLPLGKRQGWQMPCLDGQMGGILKVYREWKLCGDDAWLKRLWPKVKKALEYAWLPSSKLGWDKDRDGVLEGRQHHTLDMEMFGPSAWLEGFYLAALKAGAEMAEYLKEADDAALYRQLYQSGAAWTEKNLFNGRYYIQKTDLTRKDSLTAYETDFEAPGSLLQKYWNDETGEIKYQIGEGCEIDQLCGQWHANILGLGDIFDPTHRKTALKQLWQNNYKPSMRSFCNPWRVFALNDEAGAVICDYPEGACKPTIPIPYCEESMHGFEYQLAGLMISEGMVEEGLKIVASVRSRYDGEKRNPWNEIECGSNYARSMASFALLPIFSGFRFDLPHRSMGFAPLGAPKGFRCLWSLGSGWGTVSVKDNATEIVLEGGELSLEKLYLPQQKAARLWVDGREVDFCCENGSIIAPMHAKRSIRVEA